MKRSMCVLLLAVFTTLLLPIQGFAAPIHRYTETKVISNSITLTGVQEFYADYNLAYSYIKADLTNPNTSLKLLTSSQSTNVLDTVENLAKEDSTVVAAMNADFFSATGGGKGFSLGIEIKDGKMLQSPIYPDTMATIFTQDNKVLMDYVDFKIVAVTSTGDTREVRHMNKETTYFGDILMYTADYNNGMSPAPGGDVVEVVVSAGKILEFRRNLPSVAIPEDGCVLVVSEGMNMFLTSNFQVGDTIWFDYQITPELHTTPTAFGGGAMLVSQGKKVDEYSHAVSGRHPRSAIGVDKEGTTLYLVAVDGRQENSRGMTMEELSDLMLSLGCDYAVNLDGGGSTNMQASTVEESGMHTVNSPTENRKVINGVGLGYADTSGTGQIPGGVLLTSERDAILLGDSVTITAAPYDQNMRPMQADVTWESAQGTVEAGVFTPHAAGNTTVSAKCGESYTQTGIYVMDQIAGIDMIGRKRMQIGETFDLPIHVFDNEGHYAEVKNPAGLELSSNSPGVVSVNGKTLTAHQNGRATVSVKRGDAVSYLSVVVGSEDGTRKTKFLPTYLNHYLEDKTINTSKLVVGAVNPSPKTLYESLSSRRIEDYVNTSGNGRLLGNSPKFEITEDQHALYITLNTSGGGIRKTDANQWNRLRDAVSATGKRNLFILSENQQFGGSSLETDVFRDYLEELDKDVFVITKGEKNSYSNRNGVRYFTVSDGKGEQLSRILVEQSGVLEFYFGETVTFGWKNLYKNPVNDLIE